MTTLRAASVATVALLILAGCAGLDGGEAAEPERSEPVVTATPTTTGDAGEPEPEPHPSTLLSGDQFNAQFGLLEEFGGLADYADLDLDSVGDGWWLVYYHRTPYSFGDGATRYYLLDPNLVMYPIPAVWQGQPRIWRPSLSEFVTRTDGGDYWVFDIETLTSRELNTTHDDIAYQGQLSDGREAWMVMIPGTPSMQGMWFHDPTGNTPDTYVDRPAIPRDVSWNLWGDTFVVNPNHVDGTAEFTAYFMDGAGSVTTQTIPTPQDAYFCYPVHEYDGDVLPWWCFGGEHEDDWAGMWWVFPAEGEPYLIPTLDTAQPVGPDIGEATSLPGADWQDRDTDRDDRDRPESIDGYSDRNVVI